MSSSNLLLYINSCIEKINNQLKREGISNTAREGLLLRREVFEDVRERFDWAIKPLEDKQSARIFRLAKDRELGEDVTAQLKEIELYSKIIETIPYIKAISYQINNEPKHLTENLLEFCESQLTKIDFSLNKREIVFPSKKEVDGAFKSYHERVKPDKIPVLKLYDQPEVKQKIENLYQIFLSYSISP
jgi:hypothetical protein